MIDVLLVDDTDDDVELALTALRTCTPPPTIEVAHDAEEALAAVARVKPRLVLLDLKLEGLDGFEVLRRLRETPGTRRLPVVVLTSSDEVADIDRAYDLGANSYLRKPVDYRAFVDAMRTVMTYWLSLNLGPER